MREWIDPKEQEITFEQAFKHREIILPHIDLSEEKNIAIMRYNLQIIDERLRIVEAKEG